MSKSVPDLILLRLHCLHSHRKHSIIERSKGGSLGTKKEAQNEASESPDWRWWRGRRLTTIPRFNDRIYGKPVPYNAGLLPHTCNFLLSPSLPWQPL